MEHMRDEEIKNVLALMKHKIIYKLRCKFRYFLCKVLYTH